MTVAELEPSTRETYGGYIRRTILPALGSMELRKVRGPILDTFYAAAQMRQPGVHRQAVHRAPGLPRRRDRARRLAFCVAAGTTSAAAAPHPMISRT
jgi:hypothetical protein